MSGKCQIRIAKTEFDAVHGHLFPGDMDEHGAVLLAGVSKSDQRLTLHVREVHVARAGTDYVEGSVGYRALAPTFIHRMITRARDQGLAYLAVHNHGSDQDVGFSSVDFASHERGYPALLQIARGQPVGALVFGRRSMQADVWLVGGTRLDLERATVVGTTIQHLTPAPTMGRMEGADTYERQVRMLGRAGQQELANCCVGIVGLGGVGSLLAEYLARLGVGGFCLIDPDRIEESNLSRVVGASLSDVKAGATKVAIADRLIRQANPGAIVRTLVDDVAKGSVADSLKSCDYLFIAADSMRARLVCNAIVHQYLIPGVQLGSKVRTGVSGKLEEVMSVNRPLRPGCGCLWCNGFIDASQLAKEAKTDEERRAQAYGVEEPNPSVISLNAIAAAHAVNDFLLDYLNLRPAAEQLHYEHFHLLKNTRALVEPRKGAECSECSSQGKRYGRGDSVELPCTEG
jgi:hypothetical protein